MATTNNSPISGHTRIAGVIGWPIEHTLSPAMQNAAFKHTQQAVVYLPFGVSVAGLKSFFTTLRQINALGVNVTIPYKEKVIAYMDELAESAREMGAVNTVVIQSGKLIGHNTDGYGFIKSLEGVIQPRGKNAVLIGAGGAGRAVATALLNSGVHKLTIAELDAKRLTRLVRTLRAKGHTRVEGILPNSRQLQGSLAAAALLVNATPLGLKPGDPLPIPLAWMPSGICVMDLVYGKKITQFLKLAQRKNRVIPGWKMLLHQGAEAFRLWTGRKPPLAIMQQALGEAGGFKVA